jgi:hypothetical protein
VVIFLNRNSQERNRAEDHGAHVGVISLNLTGLMHAANHTAPLSRSGLSCMILTDVRSPRSVLEVCETGCMRLGIRSGAGLEDGEEQDFAVRNLNKSRHFLTFS